MGALLTVVVTCHGKATELPIIHNILECQRCYITGADSNTGNPVNWVAGPYLTEKPEIILACDGLVDLPFGLIFPANQICICPKEGEVGHNTRGPGIKAATGEFIVLTNQDNLFVQGWQDRVESFISPAVGLIAWRSINNLWAWNPRCDFQRGQIDLASVAVRSEIAKKVGFPFRNYDGDWDYIEACLRECVAQKLQIVKLDEVLAVHN